MVRFATSFSVLTLESVSLFKIATTLVLECLSRRIDSACANLRTNLFGHCSLCRGLVRTIVLTGVHENTCTALFPRWLSFPLTTRNESSFTQLRSFGVWNENHRFWLSWSLCFALLLLVLLCLSHGTIILESQRSVLLIRKVKKTYKQTMDLVLWCNGGCNNIWSWLLAKQQ